MRIVNSEFELLTPISNGGIEELQKIERAARTCYKSEDKITEDGESAKKLVKMLIERGHEAMLEHSQLSVWLLTDRAVSHELVRHRVASFAQESQRYCGYDNGKFGNEITVVKPSWMERCSPQYRIWKSSCERAETAYMDLIAEGCTPQEARSVLPNSTKTEIVVTANYREWRHILKLRANKAAHPDMQYIMLALQSFLRQKIPVVFDE